MIYYIGIEPKTENPIQDPKSDNPTVGKTQSGETPPISNTDIPVTKKDSNIDCVYAACEDFESFWISYPRKESKKEAEGKFSGLSQKDKQKAMTCLPLFIEYWKISKTERRYIPHAATWIGQRRWEDTLPDPSEVKSSSFKRKTPRNALTEEKDYSAGLGQFAATIT